MKKINFAISNIAWDKKDDDEMYKYLSSKKMNLEIAPTRIFGEKPYEELDIVKEYAKKINLEYNINVISMQSIWYGKKQKIFDEAKNFNELLDYTKKAIDFSNAVGCKNLVFGNPKNRNLNDFENDMKKAYKFFKIIGEYAILKNVVIAIEPNPIIYGTNFLNETQQVIEFIKNIGIKSLKVNYDLGTVIYNNENVQLLKKYIEYINHIHISEPNLEKIKKRKIHKEICKIIEDSDYNNYISIEMKNYNNLQQVKDIIEYLLNT